MTMSNDPTILLFGATGQVGHALREPLDRIGTVTAPDRDTVDFMSTDSIQTVVRDVVPDVVVNAAAYTDVDRAEDDFEGAHIVNARAPGVLAEVTREVGGWLIHYSTDYVFDGTKTVPYGEDEVPNPLNAYGRTKRAGEEAVMAGTDRYLLLRTSWVYSHRRSNFLGSMLRLANNHDTLTVVDDQIGTPTSAHWIAEATVTLLRRLQASAEAEGLSGLYHLTGEGQTSWYGFARAIFDQFEQDDVPVEPVPSTEYPTPAPRPSYTVLDTRRLRKTFDLSVPTWSEQLDALCRRMADGD